MQLQVFGGRAQQHYLTAVRFSQKTINNNNILGGKIYKRLSFDLNGSGRNCLLGLDKHLFLENRIKGSQNYQ
jgi:hypothetical protein